MSDLNWRQVAFKEICTSLLNGGTPNTNINKYWNGNIPWVTGADFANQALSQVRRRITAAAVQQSTTKMVKAGSILLVTRTGVGKIAIAPYDVAFSQDITGINFGDSVEVRFMYYCLQAHMEEFKKLNQGTSINGILKEDFLAYQINLPPLPQQRKIAKILTTVDNLIEKTESLIAKYQSIKQGMMHDLFTRGVDAKGKLRPSQSDAPELYKQSELGWIPKDWEVEKIGSVFEIQLGKMLSRVSKTGRYSYPYLANRNVQWDKVDVDELEEMDFLENERVKFSLKPDDLLVCEGGEVGRTSIWQNEIENCYYQKAIHRLRPMTGRLVPRYMLRFMRFASISGWFVNFISQSSIAHLTREKLSVMPMLVQPKDEQTETAYRIDAIATQIDCEVALLHKTILTKTALMQDLLTGKVQITPDEIDKELAHV